MRDGQLTLTLPDDLERLVQAKVSSGEYPDEQAVALEALRRLEADDNYLEHVLRDEVVPILDAMDADPSRLMPIDQAFELLEAQWRAKAAGAA